MKTATVRDLRNRFRRVSKWLESGETVRIVKRGRPFARVLPEPRGKTFLNACPSDRPLPGDIDEPLAATWDAAR